MKKTSLMLVTGLALLFLLYGAKESYAGSGRRAKKAQKVIAEAQASITKLEAEGYAAPKAKEILEKARKTYEANNYDEARELAKESLTVSSDRKLKKKAQKAKKAIDKVQAYITQWEEKNYAAPEAKKILDKARQAHKKGYYEKAKKLAEESLVSLKIEVQIGQVPKVTVQIPNPEVDLTKYKKIIVKKINDAPNALGSGVVVADLITTDLLSRGYDVIYKPTPEFGGPDADALVAAVISQWKGHTRHEHVEIPFIDKTVYAPIFYITIEMSIKMVDTKTGSIVWLGHSLHHAGSRTILPIQPVARAIIHAIFDKVYQEETQ